MKMEKLIITPKTRIYDLLEAYPQLEDSLISMAPEFRKLKNPVLRKTIARITNIGQAAAVGGLNVAELVNRLRSEVGQRDIAQLEDTRYNTVRPGWFRKEAVVNTLDIRDMLARDEQPVHEVLATMRKLEKNEILRILAPFVPAPLLDKSLSLGYQHWVDQSTEKEIRVYFTLL